MTPPPSDPRLSEFLRQHRPPPPAADPSLEDRLMASLSTAQWETSPHRPRPLWSRLLVIPVLVASCLLAYAAVRLPRQPQLSDADQQDLEQFIAETWGNSAYSDLPMVDASAADDSWMITLYANSPLD